MPIYDYDCSSCRTRTEFIHGIDAPAPRFCPACGSEGTLRKAFAPPTVHFKGSGWAKKDRSSASKTKAAAASAGDGAEGKADGAKADASGEASGSTTGSTGASKATASEGRSSSTATKSSTSGEG